MLNSELKRIKLSELLPKEGKVLEPEDSTGEDIEDSNSTESEDSHNNSDFTEPPLVDALEVSHISNLDIDFRIRSPAPHCTCRRHAGAGGRCPVGQFQALAPHNNASPACVPPGGRERAAGGCMAPVSYVQDFMALFFFLTKLKKKKQIKSRGKGRQTLNKI